MTQLRVGKWRDCYWMTGGVLPLLEKNFNPIFLQVPRMHTRWLSLSLSFLMMRAASCASPKGIVDKVHALLNGEITLEQSHTSVLDLKPLVEKRLGLFFASFEVCLVHLPFRSPSEPPKSIMTDLNELVALVSPQFRKVQESSTTHDNHLFVFSKVSIQDHLIHYTFDVATLKQDTYAKYMPILTKALSTTNSLSVTNIPPGIAPKTFVNHPNASKIYYKIYQVGDAYRKVVAAALKNVCSASSLQPSLAFVRQISKCTWEKFFPDGKSLEHVDTLPVPTSSVGMFNYGEGQFVRRGSLLAITKDGTPILAESNFIVFSVGTVGERFYYTRISIDHPQSFGAEQQRDVDILVSAYDRGILTPEAYAEDKHLPDLVYQTLMRISLAMMRATPAKVQLSQLPSYHPSQFTVEEAPRILHQLTYRTDQLALSTARRFESSAVHERVAKTEHVACWTTFLPQSQVRFLTFGSDVFYSYADVPLLVPITSTTSIRIQGSKAEHELLSDKGPWFLSTLADLSMDILHKAVIRCPEVPVKHDQGIVQHLLKLTSGKEMN